MNTNPNHAWIAARIPHHGKMCLLDRVVFWNETVIDCRASSHRATDNPLRHGSHLGIANGIEYAAQAMAVHGALLAGNDEAPAVGFLTSVRNVRWHRQRLDDLEGELGIHADRIYSDESNVLYQFSLNCAGECLMTGRASVLLDAGRKTMVDSGENPA